MRKKVLVIVNQQYDYVCEEGSVFVNGANTTNDQIKQAIGKSDYVVFVMDWHPENHPSFSKECPAHCLQNTQGSAIDETLARASESRSYFYEVGYTMNIEDDKPLLDKDDKTTALKTAFFCDPNVDYYVCGVDYHDSIKNVVERLKTLKAHASKLYILDDCFVSDNMEMFKKWFDDETKDPNEALRNEKKESEEVETIPFDKPFDYTNADIMDIRCQYAILGANDMVSGTVDAVDAILKGMHLIGYADNGSVPMNAKFNKAEYMEVPFIAVVNSNDGFILYKKPLGNGEYENVKVTPVEFGTLIKKNS